MLRDSRPAIIFADDLTGANDTGAQFARLGLRTRVCFGALQENALETSDLIVIDTDTRNYDAALAYQRVFAIAQALARRRLPVVYKKMDSTLRGAVGAELDAIIDAYALHLVVLSPAFPANQRTLLNGVLYLGDTPVAEGPFARDPTRPVTTSHLPTLLASQTQRPVHPLGLETITGGAQALAACFQALRTPSGAIVVCDAVTDAHLAVIAEAAHQLGEGCLLAGSAGLARPLAAQFAEQRFAAKRAHVLLVVGSLHPMVRQQLHELVRQTSAYVIALDLTAASDGEQWAAWLTHALHRLDSVPPAAPIVVMAPAAPVSPPQEAVLLSRLAELATTVLHHGYVNSVVATGGATVRALCEQWGAIGLDLVDEIAPGVPLCTVSGGRFDGLTLVTKAGGFGDAETLVTIVAYCQTRKQLR
ncbi:MAG TPA: hypothetical protein DCL15_15625 [Chloroflexi bacterium]|nr:hypothetical protein [Chloroflexota bacterium]HHW86063.1 four-carbon acid sugar kinase family protein [Chloroflexota bacterium]